MVEETGQIDAPTGEKLDSRIKYYWFGVACVEFITPFECDLESLPQHSYRWMNAPEVEKAAEDVLHTRLEHFRPTMIKPSQKWLDEDYLIIDVQSAKHERRTARHGNRVAQVLRRPDHARGSRRTGLAFRLRARGDSARRAFLLSERFVVAGWAAALVYDKPDATSAVIDLLEYANTQLLEFRYYDEVLTSLLSNVYSSLEGHESLLSRWRLPRRAGRFNRLRLDIMDLAERTEYAVKFISDTYYARVYRVSSAKIGVEDYKALVAEKLKTAGELYEFMVAQFNERRMFALEVVVAVLVALDVILLLRWHKSPESPNRMIVSDGRYRFRQDHHRQPAGQTPRLAIRRCRRISFRRQQSKNASRYSVDRCRPDALACHHPRAISRGCRDNETWCWPVRR